MNRRSFLKTSPLFAARSSSFAQPMTKRERMLEWLAGRTQPNYTPAAFFLHFPAEFKNGSAATRKHLEFFRQTDMDFVKIQFEQTYERQEFLKRPSDWSKLTLRKIDFYEPLLQTVRELVKEAKKESLILMTLYSPFMCAGHCATGPVLKQHLEEDPEAVKRGMSVLIESQMIFVKACIKAGVDGFYMSTQGSEARRFSNPQIFQDYIRPADLVAMKEASASCAFNILHVCDYVAPYANFDAVLDYPGHIVNANTRLTGGEMPPQEIARRFQRPYMGGLDRHGVLVTGSDADVEAEVKRVIRSGGKQFLLGADCTVANETDWNRLRHAIAVAHRTGVA